MSRKVYGCVLLLMLSPMAVAEPPLPDGAVARLGTLRFRDVVGWSSLSANPDGSLLVTAGPSGMQFFDASTGLAPAGLSGDRKSQAAVFTADGKGVLCAEGEIDPKDGSCTWQIVHRELGSGKVLRRFECRVPEGREHDPRFTPNGRFFLTVNDRDPAQATVWKTSNGECHARVKLERGQENQTALSPDGRWLVRGSYDGNMYLHDLEQGKLRHKISLFLGTHWADCHYPVFSPDGKLLITSSSNSVSVWDVMAGKLIRQLRSCGSPVAFSPDGKQFAGELNGSLRLIETSTGKLLRQMDEHDFPVGMLQFTTDGKRMVYRRGPVLNIRDVATGKLLNPTDGHLCAVNRLTFSPDSKQLAGGGWNGPVLVWDVDQRTIQHRFPGHFKDVTTIAFSPDGRFLATGDGEYSVGQYNYEAQILLWDLKSGTRRHQLSAHLDGVLALAFSRDGKQLISAGNDDRVRIWDVDSGRRLTQWRHAYHQLQAWDISPDGRTLLLVDSEVWLWDVRSGERIRHMGDRASNRPIHFGSLLDAGRTVLTWEGGGSDPNYYLYFWDAATGKEKRRVAIGGSSDNRFPRAVSADGTLFAFSWPSEHKTGLALCDLEVGNQPTILHAHDGSLSSLAFSPDGRWLASGSNDSTILLWDLRRLRLQVLWDQLAASDPPLRKFTRDREIAVTFLGEKLGRIAAEEKPVMLLIDDLGTDQFRRRESATRKLIDLGPALLPILRRSQVINPTLEVRRRLDLVMTALKQPEDDVQSDADQLRRAVRLLEQLDGANARKALEKLAAGHPRSALTRLAQEALKRMEEKGRAKP